MREEAQIRLAALHKELELSLSSALREKVGYDRHIMPDGSENQAGKHNQQDFTPTKE